ncbi:bifunctional chorismate mutase/prephenate dehydratase [Aliifodinibius salipaludis]|uniref:Bifunctional chorismate mutase/prephenate dehydratase n=1 Tax=Fodinibius salipaludis TaxID=2032627 RepID=A0A2A2G992_9BACT|nr:prephenate dehydratase [Aliifodinibius salipaludis]PAU93417.1 bifunctional chorismate mutase/prephenate dehydratase [Aliifodinibius salipaludis]
MSDKLNSIRRLLDETDKTIIKALAKRQDLVREISELKIDDESDIRDTEREEELLSKITKLAREAGLDRYFAEQLFKDIIHHSVRFQTHSLVDYQNEQKGAETVQVAYQGTDGAFSHQAAFRHFEERYSQVDCFGYDTFRQAAEAVKECKVDYAILPIENTTAGSIRETYDLLADDELHIVGEEAIRIIHCLLALEDIPVDRIRRIMSHPQAIAQCSNFLAKLHDCRVESYIDTAMSAKKVLEDGDLSQAAIAGSYAAEIYGLNILKRDLANQSENFTRFVVVGPQPVEVDPQIPCKTSLLMVTTHEQGALVGCLNIIADHGIDMTKLESRPKPNEPWKYQFYLDIEGNIANSEIRVALQELEQEASSLKVLGCYPAQVGNGEE